MKLIYWVAERLNDSTVYSIRGRRRRDVIDELREAGFDPKSSDAYGTPHKVEVEYDNAFDLLQQCLGEGGIYEASEEEYAEARVYDQRFQRPAVFEGDDDDEYETLEGVPDDDDDDDEPEREYGAHDANWYA
jgi:hypothetical protein